MSNPTENDVFMSAFEPLATNANRRNTNRRSSILKTVDANCGNEERRASRRVSWAQTYQYKELLADGTTVLLLQELNSHQKTEESITSDPLPQIKDTNEENEDQNSSEAEDKYNASAFISRLKANISMNKSMAENPNKRQNTEEVNNTSASKKPKKPKRNGSKGLTKYLSKHYEIEDQKDYETVFNTSVNKYGRQLVPRTEKADFTQLFVDDNDMNLTKMTEKSNEDQTDYETVLDTSVNKYGDQLVLRTEKTDFTQLFADDNDMNLTKMTEKSNEDQNQTNQMSLTLDQSMAERSPDSVNQTRYFTDQSLAIAEETQNLSINEHSVQSPEDGQNRKEDEQNRTEDEQNRTEDEQNLEIECNHKSDTDFNRSFSVFSVESFRRTECQDLTQLFLNNSMNIIDSTEPLAKLKGPNLMEVFKDTFGLGMTERLKQKRDEMEAKSRQTIVSDAFTPSASNSISVSDSRHTSALILTENVSQLSTDLFNSKTNIEEEEMEVDDTSKSISENLKPESTSETKCETNGEKSSLDFKTEDDSETKESDSNSVSKSETSNESDSKSNESKELTNNTSNSHIPSSLAISTISSSASETSFDLNTASPLSISVVHSSDNYLVSSPATVDPTLNFTFDRSDSSNSFDPFVHTNQSFHTDHTFYETSSPMQLSFMLREDTLCILADELERQIEDIVIPTEEQKLSVSTSEDLSDMFILLRKLDAKQNGFTYEVLNEEKTLISYLWGTFVLEIRFGSVIEDLNSPFTVRHILSINMKSLISPEEPLQMRQKDLILKFHDSHKPLITIAHDLIISSFESERQQIVSRHKTSASLQQLVSDISAKISNAEKLLTELRVISSSEICRLYPKKGDRYRLVIEILGIRKPIYLVLPINPKSYPDEVIRPEIRIRNEDKHLYCLEQFSAAFLRIEPRKFFYIRRLIRGTKAFVRAKKKIIYEKQKNLKQKNEIKSAKLPDSLTKS